MSEQDVTSKNELRQLLGRLANDYKESKDFADRIQKRTDELKQTLVKNLKDYGVEDDRGHKWLAAGDMQLKHERRVSRSFDLSAATKWVKSLGAWDEVKDVIEVTTEDRILQYAWEHGHTDVVSEFYSDRETWAFKLVDQKSYDDE